MYVAIVIQHGRVLTHREYATLIQIDMFLTKFLETEDCTGVNIQVFPKNSPTCYFDWVGGDNVCRLFTPDIEYDFSGSLEVLRNKYKAGITWPRILEA